MKNLNLILTASALIIASANEAHAIEATIKGPSRYGCTSKEYYDKTTDMVNQNDREAFTKLLGAGIASGICTMFEAGETVIIAENGIFTVKLRRRGDLKEYWAAADVLNR